MFHITFLNNFKMYEHYNVDLEVYHCIFAYYGQLIMISVIVANCQTKTLHLSLNDHQKV